MKSHRTYLGERAFAAIRALHHPTKKAITAAVRPLVRKGHTLKATVEHAEAACTIIQHGRALRERRLNDFMRAAAARWIDRTRPWGRLHAFEHLPISQRLETFRAAKFAHEKRLVTQPCLRLLGDLSGDISASFIRVDSLAEVTATTATGKGDAYSRRCKYRKTDGKLSVKVLAGNCESGTLAFRDRHFPGRDCVPASELVEVAEKTSERRFAFAAVLHAIRRERRHELLHA